MRLSLTRWRCLALMHALFLASTLVALVNWVFVSKQTQFIREAKRHGFYQPQVFVVRTLLISEEPCIYCTYHKRSCTFLAYTSSTMGHSLKLWGASQAKTREKLVAVTVVVGPFSQSDFLRVFSFRYDLRFWDPERVIDLPS